MNQETESRKPKPNGDRENVRNKFYSQSRTDSRESSRDDCMEAGGSECQDTYRDIGGRTNHDYRDIEGRVTPGAVTEETESRKPKPRGVAGFC